VATMRQPGALYGENDIIDKSTGLPIVTLVGSFTLKPKPTVKTTRRGAASQGQPASGKDALLEKYGLK
jgi:hypothetical protein